MNVNVNPYSFPYVASWQPPIVTVEIENERDTFRFLSSLSELGSKYPVMRKVVIFFGPNANFLKIA